MNKELQMQLALGVLKKFYTSIIAHESLFSDKLLPKTKLVRCLVYSPDYDLVRSSLYRLIYPKGIGIGFWKYNVGEVFDEGQMLNETKFLKSGHEMAVILIRSSNICKVLHETSITR